MPSGQATQPQRPGRVDRTKSFLSIVTGLSGNEGEAPTYSQIRMLQNDAGKLLYVGDSAVSSFLSLIQMVFEPVLGPSEFTQDPRRHRVIEPLPTTMPEGPSPELLPTMQKADRLVNLYFTNTHGLIQAFQKETFVSIVRHTYDEPESAELPTLCIMNLVFAIGALFSPILSTQSNSRYEVSEQTSDDLERADKFYHIAKKQGNFLESECGELWSVQALLLSSTFLLIRGRFETCWKHLGQAVREAYGLGIHREDTLHIFSQDDQAVRRSIWKSLFVLDRFLALSLGRPPSIYEDEVYSYSRSSITSQTSSNPNSMSNSSASCIDSPEALDATVKACSLIGQILKRVYQERTIGTNIAQELAQKCKEWPPNIDNNLKWPNTNTYPGSDLAVTIMNVNSFHIHSVILLTRPFFLYILSQKIQDESKSLRASISTGLGKNVKFSEACVSAATHAVTLARQCFEAGKLPPRHSLLIYFVFTAAIILRANDCLKMHSHPHAERSMRDADAILSHCRMADAHAERYHYILQTFKAAIQARYERMPRAGGMQLPLPNIMAPPPGGEFANPFAASPVSRKFSTSSPPPPPAFSGSNSATPAPREPMPSFPPFNPLSPGPPRTDPGQFTNPATYAPMLDLISYPDETLAALVQEPTLDETINFDMFWNWQQSNGMAPGPVQPVQYQQPGPPLQPVGAIQLPNLA